MIKNIFFSLSILGFVFGCKKNELSKYDNSLYVIENIKENFQRINTISSFDSINTINLYESAEGGVLKKFYANNKLEKMVEIHFGESGKLINEYYLFNNQLSFYFSQNHIYNRPIYYDEEKMIEFNDTVFFDINKSIVKETRSYFYENKRVLQKSDDSSEDSSETDILNHFNKLKEKK